MSDEQELIAEQKAEIAELIEDLRIAEEEIVLTQERVKQAFLEAYPESEPYSLLSLQAWLKCAAANGWDYA